MYIICPDVIFQTLLLCSKLMTSHNVTCHVPLHCPKEKEKKKKIHIKSEKRKEKKIKIVSVQSIP